MTKFQKELIEFMLGSDENLTINLIYNREKNPIVLTCEDVNFHKKELMARIVKTDKPITEIRTIVIPFDEIFDVEVETHNTEIFLRFIVEN